MITGVILRILTGSSSVSKREVGRKSVETNLGGDQLNWAHQRVEGDLSNHVIAGHVGRPGLSNYDGCLEVEVQLIGWSAGCIHSLTPHRQRYAGYLSRYL